MRRDLTDQGVGAAEAARPPSRAIAFVAAVLLVLVGPRPGSAEEPPPPSVAPPAAPAPAAPPAPAPKPLTPEQAVDAVLAAAKAKDAAALKALASKDDPDPWLVADELIRRTEFDAADAFAKAAPRVDVEKLPAYVAFRRGKPDDAAARKALAAANAALAAESPGGALVALGVAPSTVPDDVVGVRVAFGRGVALRALNRLEECVKAFRKAADAAESLGWLSRAARSLFEGGSSAYVRSDFAACLADSERCAALEERRGNRTGLAATVGNIGLIHYSLGNYARALEHDERALQLQEGLGARGGMATTLGNIGIVHFSLGNFAKALEYGGRAVEMMEELADRMGVARTLGNIGLVYDSLGKWARALEYEERALKMKEELGDRAGVALTLGNIGNVHISLGNYAKALDLLERAFGLMEEVGDRAGAARTLGNIGFVHASLGDHAKALSFLNRATREAERLRKNDVFAWALRMSARMQLKIGEPRAALESAHRAATVLDALLTGLAEEQGATAREQYAGLFEVGALASARLKDAGEATYFLESGRAGSLVEALGGKQAMKWQRIPEALHAAQIDARAEEGAALAEYTRMLATEDRERIAAASKTLDAARDKVKQVIERIQREARREADIWYPRAATMEEIQKWMGAGEALVLYAFCIDEVLALVLTKAEVRIVSLGKVADVTAACEALDAEHADSDTAPALTALRKLLIDPLKLTESTKRLLISPEGPLSYIPFAAIAADRTVVYEPSGTTYGLLLEEAKKRGEGVLAIGDPDYAGKREGQSQAVYWRGRPLVALPETQAEVKSVGDVPLLGADASEGGLRAALPKVKGGRWRSVHFACHGLIDVERPTLSSLALSKDAENDGFLTSLEVLDLDIPADLAVLSACETGKGKIVKGEGIVGLTRTFMFAGAPRVICSLWKVDDEATRALMTEFYRLWNPKDGRPGLPTAEALKKAQEFVRDDLSHPVWKHPYYWAAWVLWGLPE